MTIFLALWLTFGLCQDSQLAFEALEQQGFENISIKITDSSLVIVSYENRIYRNETLAMGVVATVLSKRLPAFADFAFIPLHGGIPLGVVRFSNRDFTDFVENRSSLQEFAATLTVEDYSDQLKGIEFSKRHRSSRRKIDLTFYPGMSAQFGNFDDHQKYYFSLIPDISMMLWNGFYLRSQVEIPIWNEIMVYSNEVRPRLITATQFLRLPKSGFAAVHMGIFPPDRWGVSSEVSYYLCKRLFRLGAIVDNTGFLLYQNKTLTYSSLQQSTYRLYGWFYPNFYNVQVGVNYSKYLSGDKGFGVRVNRYFLDTKIGFEAAKTDQDYFAKIHLSIPLLSQRRSSPGFIRIRPPWRYNWSYYSTSDAETIGKLTETGRRVLPGVTIEAFGKNIYPAYIKNNLYLWKTNRHIADLKKNIK